MMLKIIKYLWSLKKQFSKYFIIGLSAVGIDFLIMVFLKESLSVKPFLATAISQIFSVVFVFLANKYWSFESHHQTKKQMTRFFIVLIFNYSYAVAVMYLFNSVWNFDYRLVRLCSIALMVSWNFFLYKYFVYYEKKV